MSRAEVFALLHWDIFIWVPTFVNPLFMVPQLIRVWKERDTRAISVPSLCLLIFIQISFALHGYKLADSVLVWTNGLAIITTLSVLFSVLYLRGKRRRQFRELFAPE